MLNNSDTGTYIASAWQVLCLTVMCVRYSYLLFRATLQTIFVRGTFLILGCKLAVVGKINIFSDLINNFSVCQLSTGELPMYRLNQLDEKYLCMQCAYLHGLRLRNNGEMKWT